MIKAILFDMDGTLLPMDIDVFTEAYIAELAKRFVSLGYDKDNLIRGVWLGTGAMIQNDGKHSNEEVFWQVFESVCGDRVIKDKALFEDFYDSFFDNIRPSCGFDPYAAKCVQAAKETGCTVVLASNPIFPKTAQLKRVAWAGIPPGSFDHVTSYENCRYCKPDLNYYSDIASLLGVNTAESLMIGNDVGEDMVAAELGMETFLVTPCMINRKNKDVSQYRRGDLDELYGFLKSLDQ